MIRTVLTLSIVVLASACNAQEFAFGDTDFYSDYDSALQGRMNGDMPEVGDFSSEVSRGYVNTYGDMIDLELNTNGDFGWAMVYGSAMLDEDGNAEMADVIGCSGPSDLQAEFDEPANEAEITIDEITVDGEPYLEVEVVAEFDAAGTVIGVATVPDNR
jgi:hypothetical protein